MPTAYFLVPGLMLPAGAPPEAVSGETASALSSLCEGLGPASVQRLAAGILSPFALCTHHLWFWSVVTRARTTPAHAGYVWIEDHGPELATEVWDVTACRLEDGRTLPIEPALSQEEIDSVSPALRRALSRQGFVLQQWDRTWYATRTKDWDVVARPWQCQAAMAVDEDSVMGNRPAALALMQECGAALAGTEAMRRRRQGGIPAANFIWISGGGRPVRFYPPTKFRAVLSDEPVLRRWAKEAGILCQYVAPTSGGKWPAEAPPGDVIAVVSGLWDSWLRRDWDAWRQSLPGVCDAVRRLRDLARERHNERFCLVACGNGSAATLRDQGGISRGSFLSRFRKKAPPDLAWVLEQPEERT